MFPNIRYWFTIFIPYRKTEFPSSHQDYINAVIPDFQVIAEKGWEGPDSAHEPTRFQIRSKAGPCRVRSFDIPSPYIVVGCQ
jgi:hypothetical protein